MRTIEQIFGVLKNRRYNREAPYLPKLLKERIESFVQNKQPVLLVGFWGVGGKMHASQSDMKTCDFLKKLNEEVKAVYSPGLQFHFVFAVAHGVHNGYDPNGIASYVRDIQSLFDERGFSWDTLEPLWEKYGISRESIERVLEEQPEGWWEHVAQHEVIERNAEKRQRRLSPKEGAMRYYIMRNLEKEMWETEFPNAIFHAFSDSRLRSVLPQMPTFYFYARRGWSDTPWFVE